MTNNATIDESLYSRQLYVLGKDAMLKMGVSSVLIIGAKGLATEIAKNVILAGVKSVAILDNSPVLIHDLSSNFYFTHSDVGSNRAQVAVSRLKDHNQYVKVVAINDSLLNIDLSLYSIVVATDLSIDQQLFLNDKTHALNTKFISADIRGLFGSVFCDFGHDFIVTDQSGEEPLSGIVANVTRDADGVVACLEETRHGLEDGDFVSFTEVKGMHELNALVRKVQVTGPYMFKIGDTSKLSHYESGGIFTQVKQPKSFSFVFLFNLEIFTSITCSTRIHHLRFR